VGREKAVRDTPEFFVAFRLFDSERYFVRSKRTYLSKRPVQPGISRKAADLLEEILDEDDFVERGFELALWESLRPRTRISPSPLCFHG